MSPSSHICSFFKKRFVLRQRETLPREEEILNKQLRFLSSPMAMLLNENGPGSVGSLDSSICSEKALDRYTSTACYHRKVTGSLDTCHWLSKDLTTCCRLTVCVCECEREEEETVCRRTCLGTGFAVTNESQTRVNTHFTHITPLWQRKYIASATGDTLTRPWTLFFSAAARKYQS